MVNFGIISVIMCNTMWPSNLKSKDIDHIAMNIFWKDVFRARSEFTNYEIKTKNDILDQPLWLNSNVKNNNLVLYNHDATNAELCKIKDIISEQGGFYSYNVIRNKYGNILTLTEYYSLCNVIPIELKRILRVDVAPGSVRQDSLQNKLMTEKVSSVVHNALTLDSYVSEHKRKKWK